MALANDTPYGLAGYFFTKDLRRAWRVSEKLEFGIIGVYRARTATNHPRRPTTPAAPSGAS